MQTVEMFFIVSTDFVFWVAVNWRCCNGHKHSFHKLVLQVFRKIFFEKQIADWITKKE
jgi:hypothetical protein